MDLFSSSHSNEKHDEMTRNVAVVSVIGVRGTNCHGLGPGGLHRTPKHYVTGRLHPHCITYKYMFVLSSYLKA